jgi:hypothetical protein
MAESVKRTESDRIPDCPVCAGVMRVAYDRHLQLLVVCVDCHAGLSIPAAGWEVKWLKLAGKWKPSKVQAE